MHRLMNITTARTIMAHYNPLLTLLVVFSSCMRSIRTSVDTPRTLFTRPANLFHYSSSSCSNQLKITSPVSTRFSCVRFEPIPSTVLEVWIRSVYSYWKIYTGFSQNTSSPLLISLLLDHPILLLSVVRVVCMSSTRRILK